MQKIRLPAYAKINLFLNVTGKRNDGYHLLQTVMQNVSLCDYINLEKRETGIKIETTNNKLPVDETNLAYKAAELFFKETGISGGVKINIEKNIPLAAGLAGGSSDAAAVLKGLNIIYETGLTEHRLAYLGKKLGADVPFCIVGGTVFAEGIGEKLSLLPPFPSYPLVLVKPGFGISTKEVYKNFDIDNFCSKNASEIISYFKKGEYEKTLLNLQNVLENVTFKLAPEVKTIKETFLELGAETSLMCGSGPTVFGIFKDSKTAENAATYFKKLYQEVYKVDII